MLARCCWPVLAECVKAKEREDMKKKTKDVDVAADDDDGTRAEPGRIVSYDYKYYDIEGVPNSAASSDAQKYINLSIAGEDIIQVIASFEQTTRYNYHKLIMNKFFVLALFALVAACSAAPTETPAYLEPEAAAEGVEASEHDKRAILFDTSAGYRYLPEYEYKYRHGYPSFYRYEYPSVPAQAYPYSSYPYSTYPYSSESFPTVDVAADDDDGTRAEPGRIVSYDYKYDIEGVPNSADEQILCTRSLRLVAACSAAPTETPAYLEPEAAAEGVEASEHDKRAILFATSAGYRYLPEYEYKYRNGYPSFYRYEYPSVPAQTYPYSTYPYSTYPYRYNYHKLIMNKFFVLALFALVAACSAAPTETPVYLEPEAAAEGVEASEHDKRAILFDTSAGYRYLPEYEYKYRHGYPSFYRYEYPSVPAQAYPYSSYPYSTYPYSSEIDVAADDDDGTRAEPGRIVSYDYKYDIEGVPNSADEQILVLALFALVAACSAAPPETPAYLEPEAAAEGVEASEHDKRAILFDTSAGYRYLPEYEYKYRSGYPPTTDMSTLSPGSGLPLLLPTGPTLPTLTGIYEYEYTVASPSLRPLFSSGRLPADDDDDDEYLHSPIYVPLLGTGLLSEQEGLGHSSHAGPVRIGNFARTIESLRRLQVPAKHQQMFLRSDFWPEGVVFRRFWTIRWRGDA
ncbi:hypothetical protein MSG28_009890 [Choristoneura fumiferana]|uniref:Uncharacterized protein n=1 Tax=Choristoneura fumiferana TaxID=7141 RepID=A0ACC0JD34_CHOFU|nr:hypothetical protein MSG28_009890 [Choristoneura fumiferana]